MPTTPNERESEPRERPIARRRIPARPLKAPLGIGPSVTRDNPEQGSTVLRYTQGSGTPQDACRDAASPATTDRWLLTGISVGESLSTDDPLSVNSGSDDDIDEVLGPADPAVLLSSARSPSP